MKLNVLLLFSIYIFISSFAQSSGPETLLLSVEKKVNRYHQPDTVILQFKPGRVLKIKTSDGKNLRSADYVYQENAIMMITSTAYGKENIDTISFQDIVKIRGKVYGNAERKVAGTILALTGLPLSGFTMLAAAWSAHPMGTAVAMLPVFGIPVTGINLMGARSFNTGDKWTLKTTPTVSSQIHENQHQVTLIDNIP